MELGFVVGTDVPVGEVVTPDDADRHVFGVVLLSVVLLSVVLRALVRSVISGFMGTGVFDTRENSARCSSSSRITCASATVNRFPIQLRGPAEKGQ